MFSSVKFQRNSAPLNSTCAPLNRPPADSDAPDYYVQDYNVSTYLPLLSSSTFALNWFRSGAFVRKQGNTDYDSLLEKLKNENCPSNSCSNTELKALEDQAKVNQTNNQYGTAGSLGGASRLRSYAGGRSEIVETRRIPLRGSTRSSVQSICAPSVLLLTLNF